MSSRVERDMENPMADIPAGRELDALVAEKVMGWDFWDGIGNAAKYRPAPAYSTDIAAAWRIVEKMRDHPEARYRNLTLTAYCYNRTYATFDSEYISDYTPEHWAEGNGEHATPLALCRAALMTVRNGPGD